MTRRYLVAAAALLLGCNQAPTVPTIGEAPIVLSVSANTTTFRVGRPDTIIVTATSRLEQMVQLLFNSDCQILVTIRSSTGNAVVPPSGRHSCTPLATSLEFPALGTVTRRVVWTGTTDFTPPGSGVALPAGVYFVSATIDATNYSTVAPAIRVELTEP